MVQPIAGSGVRERFYCGDCAERLARMKLTAVRAWLPFGLRRLWLELEVEVSLDTFDFLVVSHSSPTVDRTQVCYDSLTARVRHVN